MSTHTSQSHVHIEEHRDPPLGELPRTLANLPRFALLLPIRAYQKTLSRTMPEDTCRFYPTCSHYGYQAIYKHGAIKGGAMAAWRLLRCNPWNQSDSYDPVP